MEGIRDDGRLFSSEGDIADGLTEGEQELETDGRRVGGVLGREGARVDDEGAAT